MDLIWDGKTPERCWECYRKLDNAFYNARIAACEGFKCMQVCESCFNRYKMLGRAEGERYERNDDGRFMKSQSQK